MPHGRFEDLARGTSLAFFMVFKRFLLDFDGHSGHLVLFMLDFGSRRAVLDVDR